MAETTDRVAVEIAAENKTQQGLAAAVSDVKAAGQEMADGFNSTTESAGDSGLGGVIGKLTEKMREHRTEQMQEARASRFFTNEIAEFIGKGNIAGEVLGKLAGGLATGGIWGVAIAGATTAVGMLSEKFRDQGEEVKKTDELLKNLATTYDQITEKTRKMREGIGDVFLRGEGAEGTKKQLELEREITWQEKLYAAERDRVKLGDETVAKSLEAGRLKWEQAIVEEMNKEEEVSEEALEQRRANIEALKNQLAVLQRVNVASKEARDAEKSEKAEKKSEKSEQTDLQRQIAIDVRAANYLDEFLKKQAADKERRDEQEVERRRKNAAEEVNLTLKVAALKRGVSEDNAKLSEELAKKQEQFEKAELEAAKKKSAEIQKLAKADAETQITAIKGVASAIGTALSETIEDAKSAGKAMAKAVIKAIEAIVMAYAAQAAAAAMAANAGIPVIGIATGTAAAGTAFAFVESLADKIPSAAYGFDVPAGLNPLTQLHEKEMVLPASIADPLRDALSGSDGIAPATNVYISAIDGPSVARFVESQAFSRALAEKIRNGR